MTFEEFERRAREEFERIPPEFRERVTGPVVIRESKRDRELAGRYTLGECQHAPNWTGQVELQSVVYLYYGSFVACARRDPDFDIDAELVETVQHEVQHHVEDQVGHPKLRDQDWAEEQNDRRRRGEEYRSGFWRGGERVDDPKWELHAVGGDVFLEMRLAAEEWETAQREGLAVTVGGEVHSVRPGAIRDDEEVFEFAGAGRSEHGSQPGDLVLVVRRRRGILDAFRSAKRESRR